MLDKLPGWVVPNDVSVKEEVAPYRGMTTSDKMRLGQRACAMAAAAIRAKPGREWIYDWADPLPESSREALRRLRMRR